MKEIQAENNASESFQEVLFEEADRLSFCNLANTEENKSGSTYQSPRTSSAQTDHLFEFVVSQPGPTSQSYQNDIIFCGKVFHEDDDQLNEYQKRDYFATIKSHSQRRSSFPDRDAAENRRISASTRISGDLTRSKFSGSGDLDYHAQRVNITSLTSMSAKSRRRMFMFGPVKFRPEMELSAIKQRQQAPRPPAAASSGGGKSQWGLLRSTLRGRSNLTSVLARSLGCIPAAASGGGVERFCVFKILGDEIKRNLK
ncbi:hypothetical protein DH2020_010616 [Rehmannia glutinosa]|uniref:Uncharacterized protein n=1 Tax=Rehmannia glutinosa TaxID=99300 RepID=A0ABR0XB46_REHGL